MSHIALTMPEAKYRSTKKNVPPVRTIRASEYRHEAHSLHLVPAKAKPEVKPEAKPLESVQAESKKAVAAKARFKIASLWPIAVGLFLAGFAPEWHALAAQAGTFVLRFTFPLPLLLAHREFGLDSQMTTMLPQLALYAQLPLDGLVVILTQRQGTSLKSTLAQLAAVHGVCALVLWLMTM